MGGSQVISRPRPRNMRLAWVVLGTQLTMGLLVAAMFGAATGPASAKAALFGVVVAVLPGLWMALWLLPRRRQVDAPAMARAFIGVSWEN